MAANPITAKFRDFGLDDDEAKVLTLLYVIGPSKASSIAEAAGVTRVQAYRVLSRLQNRNIIETSLGRPVIFSVIPPDKAIDILISEASNRVKTMHTAREQILSELSKFKTHELLAEAKHKIIDGRSQIYSTVAKMIQSAKKEVLLFIDKEDLMRMYYAGIPEELSSAFSKGVKIMILVDVDYSVIDNIQEYAKYATLRHNKIPGMNIMLVIDDSELLFSSATKKVEGFSGESVVALWMNAKNFVMGMKGLLEDNWRNAIDAETRIKVLREGGTAFQEMLIVKGAKNIEEFYSNMVETATEEISYISMPFDDQVFASSLDRSITSLGQRGIKIRILTSIHGKIIEAVKSLANFAEIRDVDSSSGFNMNVLIVDRSRVLVSPLTNLAVANANAIWSNISDFVQHYNSIFSNMWQTALAASLKISQIEEETFKAKLSTELAQQLSDQFDILTSLKGVSGASHDFSIVAKRKGKPSPSLSKSGQKAEVVVLEIFSSQDIELIKNALLGFIVKCIDIEADRKIFISSAQVAELNDLADSFNAGVEVIGQDRILQLYDSIKNHDPIERRMKKTK